MIIIKNMILYFIQIRHPDDFSSTGTRLVSIRLVLQNWVPKCDMELKKINNSQFSQIFFFIKFIVLFTSLY